MKEIKLAKTFICDSFLFDENKKPSLIGIFQDINLKSIPGKHLKAVIVTFLEYEVLVEENVSVEVEILDPDGDHVSINIPSLNLKLNPDKKEAIMVLEIANSLYEKIGNHKILVKINESVVSETKFSVSLK